MKRKTCETLKASMVETIPKSTRKVIHPDALSLDVATVSSAGMSADYRHAARVRAAKLICGAVMVTPDLAPFWRTQP